MKIKCSLIIVGLILLSINSCKKVNEDSPVTHDFGSVEDIDGNTYRTIVIGSQEWMADNLRVTKYRNGDPIFQVTEDAAWSVYTSGAYCVMDNTDNENVISLYGRLYNWYAVNDDRNLAPEGWHIPTTEEWLVMVEYLGGQYVAGDKMRETGSAYWKWGSENATNSSGFSGLPFGYRWDNGIFLGTGYHGYWWLAPEMDSITSDYYALSNSAAAYLNRGFYSTYHSKKSGYSVRCMKNE